MKGMIQILIILSTVICACSQIRPIQDNEVTLPVLISEPRLIYPIEAKQNNLEGKTQIIFAVSKEGVVTTAQVHKTSIGSP